MLQGAMYYVVFTDADQMPPPYRIDNYCEVRRTTSIFTRDFWKNGITLFLNCVRFSEVGVVYADLVTLILSKCVLNYLVFAAKI